MATVGYLLGAGASAECIPVVNGMAKDLELIIPEIIKALSEFDGYSYNLKSKDKKATSIVTNVLSELKEICETHFSIDTYAKKLYLTDKDAFDTLKLDLSLYFTLRQILKNSDKRYDNFFSSILSEQNRLPSKIKVISWNYDFQIEKSFVEFNESLGINGARNVLGILSPSEWDEQVRYNDTFSVLKLNGSARIKSDGYDGYLFNNITKDKEDDTREVITTYLDIILNKKPFECELKFAWENENYHSLYNAYISELRQIEVLVVIGYSFPFFNRSVDRFLFASMQKLKTIYIQDTSPSSIEETMEEFITIKVGDTQLINVIHKTNLNQFVFPKELDIT